MQLDNRVVIDSSGRGSLVGLGPVTPLINNYGNHPITKEFNNGISFYPLARPIDTVKVEDVEAISLLIAGEQMWAESNIDSKEFTFDETLDIAGPFDLGVVLIRKINSGTRQIPQASSSSNKLNKDSLTTSYTEEQLGKKLSEKEVKETPSSFLKDTEVSSTPSETMETDENSSSAEENSENTIQKKSNVIQSRLVIIGNSMFITNNLFNQQLNGDVFLNSVQWLVSKDDQPLLIRPKEAKNRRINLTPLKAGLLTFLTLVFFPLGGLIAGVMTWLRRQ